MSERKSIDTKNFSIEDLVFGESKEGVLRDGTNYKKTPISVRRSDGTVGPLIILSEICFSFGIQKDTKFGTHTVPLVLYNKEGPSPRQELFAKTVKNIWALCVSKLNSKLKPCLYGRDDSPIMYVKLDYDKERNEFRTIFREREDMEDKSTTSEVKPEKYVGKYCLAKAALRVDNAFEIKDKSVTLQIRAHTVILGETKHKETEADEDILDEM